MSKVVYLNEILTEDEIEEFVIEQAGSPICNMMKRRNRENWDFRLEGYDGSYSIFIHHSDDITKRGSIPIRGIKSDILFHKFPINQENTIVIDEKSFEIFQLKEEMDRL